MKASPASNDEMKNVFARFHLNCGAIVVTTTTIEMSDQNVILNGSISGQSMSFCDNGTVQRAAAKDIAIAQLATTAAPLQPMVTRHESEYAAGSKDCLIVSSVSVSARAYRFLRGRGTERNHVG